VNTQRLIAGNSQLTSEKMKAWGEVVKFQSGNTRKKTPWPHLSGLIAEFRRKGCALERNETNPHALTQTNFREKKKKKKKKKRVGAAVRKGRQMGNDDRSMEKAEGRIGKSPGSGRQLEPRPSCQASETRPGGERC